MAEKPVVSRDAIAEFCRRHYIRKLSLFGSVLRDDFRPDSDIDVLVSFSPDARMDLFDLVDMQDELSAIFGRGVDLVCREGIERSYNYIRKKAILSTAEVLYAA